jgi:hypothetical protein
VNPRSMTIRRPARASLAAGLLAVATGCGTTLKDLAPAIEANQANIGDLSTNVLACYQKLRPLAVAAWDAEIESRRTAVLKELQLLGAPYRSDLGKLVGAQIEKDLKDANLGWSEEFSRLGTALACAAGNATEFDRLEAGHPVLSALALLKVKADRVASDARRLRGPEEIREKRSLADEYPYVARAIQAKSDTLQSLDEYTSVVSRQLELARVHAELLVFAAKTNADLGKALGQVISDKGLQGQLLGLIKDERWKSAGRDALAAITENLIGGAAAQSAGDHGD